MSEVGAYRGVDGSGGRDEIAKRRIQDVRSGIDDSTSGRNHGKACAHRDTQSVYGSEVERVVGSWIDRNAPSRGTQRELESGNDGLRVEAECDGVESVAVLSISADERNRSGIGSGECSRAVVVGDEDRDVRGGG